MIYAYCAALLPLLLQIVLVTSSSRLGVKFKNPIPLLWQHNSREPVGNARLGKPTKDGITFEARIPKVSEPGRLKDRLDEVWQSVKAGLVRGVSIGFKAIEVSFLKEGGVHFLESEILELSIVTIPANAEATIDEIKAFDLGQKTMEPRRKSRWSRKSRRCYTTRRYKPP